MSSYEHLHVLARYILPEEIIDNFDDEQAILPTGYTLDILSELG